MRVDRLGEGAAILRDVPRDPVEVASSLEAASLPGLIEAVACYDTVGVYFDASFDLDSLEVVAASPSAPGRERRHTIPVCYEYGEDLESVSKALGLSAEEVVRLHAAGEYRCFAVGFCPGFPYLGYLPDALSGLPRLRTPRQRVARGSVAVTGRQTGVYPLPRPGGWSILGRTPVVLVDVEDRFFPIRAGDIVRFLPIEEDEFRAREGERL
ncbi:MAG TPA: carboxyltransferase domain-containing protein [Fimbriimonas sp.]